MNTPNASAGLLSFTGTPFDCLMVSTISYFFDASYLPKNSGSKIKVGQTGLNLFVIVLTVCFLP